MLGGSGVDRSAGEAARVSVALGPASNEASALLAAARWLEALMQGPAATTLAVLAVAATGLMMLGGRLPIRRGLVVTLGCFVLFGAPAIARGIMKSAAGAAEPVPAAIPPMAFTPPPPSPPSQPAPPAMVDPYAGASIMR